MEVRKLTFVIKAPVSVQDCAFSRINNIQKRETQSNLWDDLSGERWGQSIG